MLRESNPAAGAVVLLGAVVLVGWWLDVPEIVQIHRSWAPMQFNTALCFLMSGSAGLTLDRSRRTACILAAAVVSVALATIAEYVTGASFGIDELLHHHSIVVNTSHVGRMAPNTAACFVLAGGALLLRAAMLPSNARNASITALVGILVAVPATALFGYASGIQVAYGWGTLTQMAMHTAVGFCLLALAISTSVRQPAQSSDCLSPWQFSVPTTVTLAVVSCLASYLLSAHDAARARRVADGEAEAKSELLANLVEETSLALVRMARRFGGVQSEAARAEWQADASRFLDHESRLRGIGVLDRTGKVKWLDSRDAQLSAERLEHEIGARTALGALADTGTATVLDQRDLSVALLYPVRSGSAVEGTLVGVLRISDVLSLLGKISDSWGLYQAELLPRAPPDGPAPSAERRIIRDALESNGLATRIRLRPRQALFDELLIAPPMVILVVALLGSLLLGALLHFATARHLRAAQAAGRRFRSLLDGAPDALLIVRANGDIVMCNEIAAELCGLPAPELVGRSVDDLVPDASRSRHPDLRASFHENPVLRPMSDRSEIRLLRGDGRQVPVEISLGPLGGDEPLVCATLRDVTTRRQMARDLELHAASLKETNYTLDQFASSASHDLKAPLTGIAKLVKWVEDDLRDLDHPEVHENLDMIKNRILRMDKLLDDLLAYARTGRKEHTVERIQVEDLIDDVVHLLDIPKSFAVEIEEVPEPFDAPRVPLEQVLRNLIGNAVKHHDRDHGVISIRCRSLGDLHEFEVEDDGAGISARYHEKIFGLFETLKSRDQVEGSGMGLALVRRLVALHGGTISVISGERERGAIFRFTWGARQ